MMITPRFEHRLGGVVWDKDKRIATRIQQSEGTCSALGPIVKTSGKVEIRMRIVGCGFNSHATVFGEHLGFGVVLDSEYSPLSFAVSSLVGRSSISTIHRLWSRKNTVAEKPTFPAVNVKTYADKVVKIVCKRAAIFMGFEGHKMSLLPVSLPIPSHVRPVVYLRFPGDAVEILSIHTYWCSETFALMAIYLKRKNVPNDLLRRIFEILDEDTELY